MATVFNSKVLPNASVTPPRVHPALIGELLLQDGVLTEHDVARVVTVQRENGARFGEVAVKLGLVRAPDISRALARQYDYPYVSKDSSKLSPLLATAYDPFGHYSEVFRGLRSHLMLRWFSETRRTLAIAAPRAKESSIEVAANLAIVFAQLGERTLLIEGNLRTPRAQTLFGLTPTDGLADVLAGRGSFQQALTPVEGFRHLCVMCGGGTVPNPQELLSRSVFSYVMENAPGSFDVVIVDAPPVLESADAQIIAARSGGCMLVTRRHRTKIQDVKQSQAQIELAGVPMLGAVVRD